LTALGALSLAALAVAYFLPSDRVREAAATP
jgi:hypothetical protein